MKSNTNDPTKGPWLIFIFIAVLMVAAAIFSGLGAQKITYTYKEFEGDLTQSKVDSVIISQNRETPTGVATIKFRNGIEQKLNIPNVVEFQNKLENSDVNVYVANVPKDNWFLMYVLPALCLVIGAVLFFSLISRGGNGGAAGKMMSFGKSKAKMSHGRY